MRAREAGPSIEMQGRNVTIPYGLWLQHREFFDVCATRRAEFARRSVLYRARAHPRRATMTAMRGSTHRDARTDIARRAGAAGHPDHAGVSRRAVGQAGR